MPVEPDPEEILLRRARADLVAARLLQPYAEASDENVGTLCQGAVEKSLKAVLTVHGLPAPFTHDLQRLLDLMSDGGLAVPAQLATSAFLTPFGVAWRYDLLAISGVGSSFDRDRAVEVAAAAVAWAEQEMPGL